MSRWKQHGTLEPKPAGRRKGKGKLAPYREFLITYITRQPDITLPELADVLKDQFSVSVTPSGLSRFLTLAGYTFKKSSGRHRAL